MTAPLQHGGFTLKRGYDLKQGFPNWGTCTPGGTQSDDLPAISALEWGVRGWRSNVQMRMGREKFGNNWSKGTRLCYLWWSRCWMSADNCSDCMNLMDFSVHLLRERLWEDFKGRKETEESANVSFYFQSCLRWLLKSDEEWVQWTHPYNMIHFIWPLILIRDTKF